MADPICRWRNSSIKQLLEFNSLFPYNCQSKAQARAIIEKKWALLGGTDFFQTPYQLAAQMGLYYEDDISMYPHFNKALTVEEAFEYMNYWGRNYYAPNPYTKSLNVTNKGVIINNYLVNWCIEHVNPKFSDALQSMYGEKLGNTDILINMINAFTDVSIENDQIQLKQPDIKRFDSVYVDYDKNDRKAFFEHLGGKIMSDTAYSPAGNYTHLLKNRKLSEFVLGIFQILEKDDKLKSFYDYRKISNAKAPSTAQIIQLASAELDTFLTGLFLVADLDEVKRRNVVTNTTRWFEVPLSFNGTTVYLSNQWNENGNYQLTLEDLKKFITHCYNGKYIISKSGNDFILSKKEIKMLINYPLQQIVYGAPGTGKSHGTDGKIVEIYPDKEERKKNVFRTTFHPDSDYSTFVGCYKPTMGEAKPIYGFDSVGKTTKVLDNAGNEVMKRELTYEFVPQAFTKAYIRAMQLKEKGKPVFLVVEEINRGNCAQIFGDLFQLLDRDDNGWSKYAIKPDSDLEKYLVEMLGNDYDTEEGMKLPPNLYIWATMNTSDQSLFPIDSAFKRRWDWKYVPIKYDNKDWHVVLNDGAKVEWIELQKRLNLLIYDATESEDKMIGDWFVKAKGNEIDEETLVGKIIFYLWNDVAKVDAGKLFNLNMKELKGKDRNVIFSDFYTASGNINSEVVKAWLINLEFKFDETLDNGKPTETPQEEINKVTYSRPEYAGILQGIEEKCKENGLTYRYYDSSAANSMDIKFEKYPYSTLEVSVALNKTGTPSADVKLWIEATPKAIETRDKLRENGAGEFFASLVTEESLSYEEMAKDFDDSVNKVRGWRLRNTAITFAEANAKAEANWLFDVVKSIRDKFADAL